MHRDARTLWRRGLSWLPFLLLTCGPVLWLVARSFFPGGELSLSAYGRVLGDPARRSTLWNSLLLGGCVVVVTTLVGVPFGFLVSRTELRLRRLYESAAILPLLLPPYIAGIAWVQLLPLHGLSAIVFILSSALFPVVALLSARAFREIGRDVEDAARVARGDGAALFKVTLPLARAAIVSAALLVFVFAISDFVVPDFFSFAGKGSGTFQVFATEVYGIFARELDPVTATATAVPLAVVSVLALLIVARFEGGRSLASLQGAHVEPRPFRLGRWSPLAHLFLVGVLGVTAVVPVAILGRLTFAHRGPPPTPPVPVATNGKPPPPAVDLSLYRTADPVATALKRYGPDLVHSVRNASVAVLLLLLAAIGPARRLAQARRVPYAVRVLVLAPLAFPSLLIGMACSQMALGDSDWQDRVFRGWGLVSVALASRFLPVAVLGLRASWVRLAPEIEEAGRLVPVSALRRFLRVSLPLLRPGLIACGILTLTLALREFDAIALLQGAQEMLTHRIYNLVHYAQDAVVGALCLLQMAAIFLPWAAVRLLVGGRGR